MQCSRTYVRTYVRYAVEHNHYDQTDILAATCGSREPLRNFVVAVIENYRQETPAVLSRKAAVLLHRSNPLWGPL